MVVKEKKSKILILAVSDSCRGGGQAAVFNLASFLSQKEDLLLICPRGDLYQRSTKAGINVFESEINFFTIYRLRKLLSKYDKITINTHLLGTTFWIVLAILFKKNVSVIVTLHNPIIYENIPFIKKTMFPIIIRLLGYKVNSFIAVSMDIVTGIKKYTNNDSVFYLPSSISIDKFKFKEESPQKQFYNIAIVGRLSFAKGHAYYISAAEKICKERNNIKFYIIGEGELRETLETSVNDKGLNSKVIFTGYANDMFTLLKEIDIIVMPSLFEGVPFTLLEMMALGIPVIASAVGGIPNVIVNRHSGILVTSKNADEISNAIIELIDDKDLRNKIRLNARQKVTEDFNSEKIFREYYNILSLRD